jgi:mersacidin/lichenicidin family type 2 lantibiotic
MRKIDVIRAWRDPEYRESLSAAERAALPAHPSEVLEVSEEALLGVIAGSRLPESSGTSTPSSRCDCCCA